MSGTHNTCHAGEVVVKCIQEQPNVPASRAMVTVTLIVMLHALTSMHVRRSRHSYYSVLRVAYLLDTEIQHQGTHHRSKMATRTGAGG